MSEWTQSASGERIYLFAPEKTRVVLTDIVHGLAQINRYGGQASQPYSVAQHSVLASFVYPNVQPLGKLMHDSGEYIVGDVLGPYKKREEFAFIRALESRSVMTIFQQLGLESLAYPRVFPEEWWMTPEVRIADEIMLCAEARALMPPNDFWNARIKKMEEQGVSVPTLVQLTAQAAESLHMRRCDVICWSFEYAREAFLKRFTQLTGRSY